MECEMGGDGQVGVENGRHGWVATQCLVGGRVEIRYHLPRHSRHHNAAAPYHGPVAKEEEWDLIRGESWHL